MLSANERAVDIGLEIMKQNTIFYWHNYNVERESPTQVIGKGKICWNNWNFNFFRITLLLENNSSIRIFDSQVFDDIHIADIRLSWIFALFYF